MKRALTISMAFALALPLLADEQQGTAKRTTEVTPAPASQEDSPMVQAMRRANRRGKTARKVITNETLQSSTGHITTTTVQRPVEVPEPKLTPSELATKKAAEQREEERKRREIGAAESRKKGEEREENLRTAARRAEEGLYDELDDDPARSEHEADEAARQKPPQN